MQVPQDITDIQAKLIGFLKKEIFDSSIRIEADTDLIASGLDSFSLLKILVFVEKTFEIRIPDKEINEKRISNVRNLSLLIYELPETA